MIADKAARRMGIETSPLCSYTATRARLMTARKRSRLLETAILLLPLLFRTAIQCGNGGHHCSLQSPSWDGCFYLWVWCGAWHLRSFG